MNYATKKGDLKAQLKSEKSRFQTEYQRLFLLANTCFPELKRSLKSFDQDSVITNRRLFEYEQMEPLDIGVDHSRALKKVQDLEQIFEKRLEQATKDSLVQLHVKRIQEEILNLRCPACKIVFIDFTGCFALICYNCGCGFCAWCLQNCGTDAHRHVSRCSRSLTNGDLYGPMEAFHECHEARKKELVDQYYKQVIADPLTIEKVKESLSLLDKEP